MEITLGHKYRWHATTIMQSTYNRHICRYISIFLYFTFTLFVYLEAKDIVVISSY